VGHQRGLTVLGGLALLAALAGAALSGCGDDPQRERKRALLQPSDAKRKAAEEREKRRLVDKEGELLPSGETAAGIMVPRGLTLYRTYEGQSFYKGNRVTAQQLERFFSAQLLKARIERTDSMVLFAEAVPRSNPKAIPIDLRITRLRGSSRAIEVVFRGPRPGRKYDFRPKVDEAQLEQARRYAD
jgi:hypothetical protein